MYSFISLFRGSAWLKKWSATIVANAVSIYALDTVSTVAGVLLVASGLLAGIGPLSAAMLLGASYVLWAAGLSSSLSANWRLLEATGTSTSLLSKLAYDLFPIERVSIRRFLTASGYLLFEIVKELPYYLAVFGVVLVSATFSVEEALIFLAGANVGAASYEYELAWSTRALLQGPQQGEYASFDNLGPPQRTSRNTPVRSTWTNSIRSGFLSTAPAGCRQINRRSCSASARRFTMSFRWH